MKLLVKCLLRKVFSLWPGSLKGSYIYIKVLIYIRNNGNDNDGNHRRQSVIPISYCFAWVDTLVINSGKVKQSEESTGKQRMQR